MLQLSEERQAQITDYAKRHGQEPSVVLDDMVAAVLEWETRDYQEAVQGIREGLADIAAGRTTPLNEVFDELRVKHGLSR